MRDRERDCTEDRQRDIYKENERELEGERSREFQTVWVNSMSYVLEVTLWQREKRGEGGGRKRWEREERIETKRECERIMRDAWGEGDSGVEQPREFPFVSMPSMSYKLWSLPYNIVFSFTCTCNESTEVPNARLCSLPQKEHACPDSYIYSGNEVVRNTFCAATT